MEHVRKFALDVGWVFLGTVGTYVIGFPLSILLARWLGADDWGVYRMVATIQGVCALIATFGVSVALIKYTAEYKYERDKLTQFVTAGLATSVSLGVLVGVLLWALSGLLADLFQMPSLSHLLKILAFAFPFSSVFQSLTGLLNGLREMRTFAFLTVLQSLLTITFTVVFIAGFKLAVEGAIIAIVCSVAATGIMSWYFARNYLRFNIHHLKDNIQKLLSFGSRVFGSNVVAFLSNQGGILITGYFLAAKEEGYYGLAVSLGSFFLLIPSSIATITYPAASEYWSQNNHMALQTMIDKSIKYSTCALLPIGLGVGFFAKDIITLIYGAEYINAAVPLCIFTCRLGFER
jgi:O-antigen/teichoic acid export membrane protein